ncbi:MAG: hypothetical protein U0441_00190 [Polyangiaceae bacterium]
MMRTRSTSPELRTRAKALCAAVLATLIAATAAAQQPPAGSSTAKAAATAAPRASGAPSAAASASPSSSASALPAGHPPMDDPGAQPGGDLPPGHPPTGGMPPGHPPTDDGDPDDDGSPQGGNPHGGGGGNGMFQAPEDTATDDPTLPVGTILLTLKDAQDKPIPTADVTLGIVHNTVAAGESRDRKTGISGPDGAVRWDGLPHGSGTSFRASVVNGAASFGTDPFTLGDRAGKRVVLHVYAASSNINETLIATQGLVYLSLGEDSITFQNMYGIINVGQVAWVPENQTIELPDGYKAYNRPDAMDGVGVDEVNGKGVLRGTIGPGQHEVQFRYQVNLDGGERQTFRIALPPRLQQMRVIAESSKTMGVEVKGFPAARKSQNGEGKRVLVTERRFQRDDPQANEIEITLTGLPTPGPGRWVAVALALGALVLGLSYVNQRRNQSGPDEETRADLLDAREALLREIVELTRAHRDGEIGDKTYGRLRNALLDALERLQTKIAEATPKRRKSRVADEPDRAQA